MTPKKATSSAGAGQPASKPELRRRFRTLRAEVSRRLHSHWGPAERDHLFAFLEPYLDGQVCSVLSYFALGSEPLLLPRGAAESWYFPTVVKETLYWFPWGPAEPLPPVDLNGLRESRAAQPWPTVVQSSRIRGGVCFVPQLAVDAQGYRLGYGGGYYDRFLGDGLVSSSLLLVAVSHEDLMVAELPRESHDVPVDIVVTRKELRLLIGVDQMLSKLGIAKERSSPSGIPSG